MNHRPHHARTSSQGRRAPLRRGASYNHSRPQSRGDGLPPSKPQCNAINKPQADPDVAHIEDEESGMASFLQFWYVPQDERIAGPRKRGRAWLTPRSATCEKQIVTPDSTILYCSEACRRTDISRPTSIQSIQSLDSVRSPPAIPNNGSSYFDHPPADIVPQMSPTVLRPLSTTFSDLSLSDHNSVCTDDSEYLGIHESDSLRYLDQYYSDQSIYSRNTRSQRASTIGTEYNNNNLPSLVHSPSSSYGTVASNASYRPYIPRHNPFAATFTTKSVDIAIPSSPTQLMKDASLKSSASTLTSFRVAEAGDISYNGRDTVNRSSRDSDARANRSLKQLFSHEAMTAPPKKA